MLIVDDEPLIRWSLGEALARRGYQVIEAADARSALAHVAEPENSIAAVLLDLRLPDSQDLELLKAIKAAAPHAPVILMTAYGRPGLGAEAVTAGAYCVIDKPFDVSRVVDLVAEALTRND